MLSTGKPLEKEYMMNTSTLGDRIKKYERFYDSELIPRLPVILRLDGKSFHQWTKGCVRPFDERLQNLMDETTKKLIDETHVLLGYTQSDEISLLFYSEKKVVNPILVIE